MFPMIHARGVYAGRSADIGKREFEKLWRVFRRGHIVQLTCCMYADKYLMKSQYSVAYYLRLDM